MTRESTLYRVTVTASCRQELESQLDRAINNGITKALNSKSQGIVLTRHNYTTFTVELSHEVPFGTTLERDQLLRSGKSSCL